MQKVSNCAVWVPGNPAYIVAVWVLLCTIAIESTYLPCPGSGAIVIPALSQEEPTYYEQLRVPQLPQWPLLAVVLADGEL